MTHFDRYIRHQLRNALAALLTGDPRTARAHLRLAQRLRYVRRVGLYRLKHPARIESRDAC